MARKKKNEDLMDIVLAAPWWVGVALAAATYVFAWFVYDYVHIPGWRTNQIIAMVDVAIHQPALRQISWLFIAVFLAGAAGSAVRGKARAELLDRQKSLDTIRNLTWQAFERLVAEAYHRLGYHVIENGQQGADGGVDLFLRKNGKMVLVQCKRWRSGSVGVPVVREMYGLMKHHGAAEVKIICVGQFTAEAVSFARGKAIELVSGEDVLRLVQSVQTTHEACGDVDGGAEEELSVPSCPRCGGQMVKRKARKTQTEFLGCLSYPKCKGWRNIEA